MGLSVRETVVFAMLGSVMFCSKLLMEALPNVHLIGVLTVVYTLVYRKKALVPIYVYVLLNGLYAGFSMWWFPYVYIWTILWGLVMLIPRKLPKIATRVVIALILTLHGLSFGTLYAPAQALMFRLTAEQTVAWIIAGLPWDVIHAAGNLLLSFLVPPLVSLLRRLNK